MHQEDMDGMTRRDFLRASCVTGTSALLAGFNVVSWADLANAASLDPLPQGTGILVMVTLYGGNDGLNTVIPYADNRYYSLRPDLAYSAAEVLKLDNQLGLNPGMTGMKKLWDAKKMAIINGVGYPNSDRSHFRSMDIWQSGSPNFAETSGWIGRWLDYSSTNSLSVLNIGSTVPPMIVGKKVAGSTLPINGLKPPTGNIAQQLKSMAKLPSTSTALAKDAATAISDLFTTATATSSVMKTPISVPATEDEVGGATTGGSGQLGAQLDVVARLINANVPTRVYSVSLGGFDTHSAEKNSQTNLLTQLSAAVSSFMRQIDATSRKNDVTVVVYSEFGRRVAANLTQGTDHGTAGPVFVVSNRINGGFYGEQPSLSNLKDDDLQVTTDFRDIYATLLEKSLKTDAGTVLGKWNGRVAGLF